MSLAIRSTIVSTLVIAFAFLAPPAHSQSPTSGAVSGSVGDSLGLPLSGVNVTLRSQANGTSRSTATERDGVYRFALVAPGSYDLRIEGFGYHPLWLTGVRVRAGGDLEVPIRLSATDPTLARLDSMPYDGGATAGSSAGGVAIHGRALEALPDRGRDLGELAALASIAGEDLSVEGLPASLTQIRVDGMVGPGAPYVVASASPLRGMSIPWIGVEGAEVAAGIADTEWGGGAGGVVNAASRIGSREMNVRAFGAWSQGSIDTDFPGGDDLDAMGMRGGVLVSGPIARDTSSFVVGVETYRRPMLLSPARGVDSLTGGFRDAADERYDTTLPEGAWEGSADAQVITGFGRLDWRLSSAHHLRVGVNAGTAGDVPAGFLPIDAPYAPLAEGTEMGAFATLSSRLGRSTWQELRVGYNRADRDYAALDPGSATFPSTLIAAGALAVGGYPGMPQATQQSALTLGGAFQYWGNRHRIKLGADVSLNSREATFAPTADRFLFADLDRFGAGTGLYEQVQTGALGSSYSSPAIALYIQDSWTPIADVDLMVGLRYDTERLPTSDIVHNQPWFDRTGIDNADVPSSVGGISPRAALTWDVGRRHEWIVNASGGVFIGRLFPETVAEAIGLDQGTPVNRGVGPIASWPAIPASATPAESRLALLDPETRAPRTTRGNVGVSRHLGSGTSLHLSATLRRTDFLPRRADLNLQPEPLFEDQNGRPVYGVPQTTAGLLTPAAGTNRRFVDIERVDVTSTDGWSDYYGVTAAVQRTAGENLTLLGSYTFSSTRDNWSARFPMSGVLNPFPGDSALSEWTEGTSDLDVPHRAVLGAQMRLPSVPALSLAGLYRFRSGRPFTPTFAAGVDANADGFDGNDPAFVDTSVEGVSALVSDWSCLSEQQGGFAERNACRADAVHSLDLRLGLRLGSGARFAGELFVDAIDLVRTGAGDYPDPALYLLDPAGTLTVDAAAGTVDVPLIANPRFGEALAGTAPGRTIRVGVRINY